MNAEVKLPGRRSRDSRLSNWLNWFRDADASSGSARLFLLLAPLLYAAYALVTPPFQTPDEHQHFFRAWQLSEFHAVGERRSTGAGGVLPVSLGEAAVPEIGSIEPHAAREVMARPVTAMFERNTAIAVQSTQFYDFRGSVIYSPAGYVPQVAAIWIGRSARLSIETIIRLGRVLNGGLAILLIYFAIRVTPVGALPIMWVGLLPMSASASASFGQDGIVIGGACLLTGIGMRVLFDERWTRTGLLMTAGLVSAVTLAKICYFPLALIGAQPFTGGKQGWRRVFTAAAICVVALLLTALWLRAVAGITMLPRLDIPPAAERLKTWLHDPSQLFRLLQRTYVWNGPYVFHTLFKFGWLNVGPVRSAEFLSFVGLFLALIAGDPAAQRLRRTTRFWLLSVAGSIALLVTVAIYLYSRPAADDWVQGLQARYLIPVAPAFLLAILPKRAAAPPYCAVLAIVMLCANALCLRAIFSAFYV